MIARIFVATTRLVLIGIAFSIASKGTSQEAALAAPEAEAGTASVSESKFGGPFAARPKMTGDWFGMRTSLAEQGVTFDIFGTQFYQGVASGGRVRDWDYGVKMDYLFGMDGEKVGLWKGLFVNLHGETRVGKSVNQIDGLLAPSNIAMAFPKDGEDVSSLTGIKFTQALSENFAVYFGKILLIGGTFTFADFFLRATMVFSKMSLSGPFHK